MSNLFSLIQNEINKIYIQKSTWIMYIFLAVIILGFGLITNFFGEERESTDSDSWRAELQQENEELAQEMEEEEFLQDFNTSLIEQNNYYLENDIQPAGYDAWQFLMKMDMMLSIVSLFTIIIAAGIVANEFRWGTIKLLLIRPISRSKILLSKYLAVLLFSLVTLLFVVVFSWVIGAVFFGVEGLNPHIVMEKVSGLEYVSVIQETAGNYGYKLVNLVMMGTFAFMISSIFRNSALAIGTAVFLMMAGNSIVSFFSEYSWSKYILFANTDLSQYANGAPWIEGMTLPFSIAVLLVYFAVFIAASWGIFTKRDIAGQ
ncbi:ABC transporter permease [Oceanobacillus neutriphilus]|uniref:ABC transporter permease n=1 Tax=Oceanobacillus neutriphilus TaxID=531815 RepID=A0ABQ2NRU8_9BACI|nr:ABC transporter permease [Oceanobacillus neutriphilus]GGP09098.1 hypothetical protein GCM10011346_11790 [Oceanobacillus neutriphilus]